MANYMYKVYGISDKSVQMYQFGLNLRMNKTLKFRQFIDQTRTKYLCKESLFMI